MRWDNWGRFVHDSRCLTLDGRVVAQWAVNTLRKDLGDDFLERASQRKDAHPIFGSSLWPINDVPWVFANLFSLATQLEMLRFQNKLVRKSMSNNLEAINWAHGLLELEIGGLASRSGWRCAFEPALGNGRKGDVQCKQGSSTLFVEATSMQMSDKERTVLAFHNRLSWQMYLIRSEHEVLLDGDLPNEMSDEEIDAFLQQLEAAAMATRKDGQSRPVRGVAGLNLTVTYNPAATDLMTIFSRGLVINQSHPGGEAGAAHLVR
jgi:hypothetical protein